MTVSPTGLIRLCGLLAVVAGLLFVLIQPLHPADTLGSVTTAAWAAIHNLTLLMTVLFLVGIIGIHARQVREAGWLGVVGLVTLSLGLLLTAGFVFVEALLEPLLASVAPQVVEGLLALVEGQPTSVDLGLLPVMWSLSGALFLGGCILFGIATFRARVLPRSAALLFAAGILVSAPLSAAFDAPRLTAVPIGLGLAWLGYALWSERRAPASSALHGATTPEAATLSVDQVTGA